MALLKVGFWTVVILFVALLGAYPADTQKDLAGITKGDFRVTAVKKALQGFGLTK